MEKGIRMDPGRAVRGKPQAEAGRWDLRASETEGQFLLLPPSSHLFVPRKLGGLTGWGSLVLSYKRVGGFADS